MKSQMSYKYELSIQEPTILVPNINKEKKNHLNMMLTYFGIRGIRKFVFLRYDFKYSKIIWLRLRNVITYLRTYGFFLSILYILKYQHI